MGQPPLRLGTWLESFELMAQPVGGVGVEHKAGGSNTDLHYGLYFVNDRGLIADATPTDIATGTATTILAWIKDKGGNVLVGTSGTYGSSASTPGSASGSAGERG